MIHHLRCILLGLHLTDALAWLSHQRRGSDAKEDSGDKPRRNVSWHDKSNDVTGCGSERR